MAVSAELGKPLEDYLKELVKSGRYRSRSEVLREGVRLVQEREARLEVMIAQGLADAKAGRLHPAEEVFDDLAARYLDK